MYSDRLKDNFHNSSIIYVCFIFTAYWRLKNKIVPVWFLTPNYCYSNKENSTKLYSNSNKADKSHHKTTTKRINHKVQVCFY